VGSFNSLDAYILELKGDHARTFLKWDFRGADVAPGGVGDGSPAVWTDGFREREREGFRGSCVVGERSFHPRPRNQSLKTILDKIDIISKDSEYLEAAKYCLPVRSD
jgi:hypothetical protein